jgi:serine/threonine protein kinase
MDCDDAVLLSTESTPGVSGLYRFSHHGTVFYARADAKAPLKGVEWGWELAVRRLLPPRPADCNWADLSDHVVWSRKLLKEARYAWHSKRIDIRELDPIKHLNHKVVLCRYKSELVCSKIARFEHELPDIEREAQAYQIIDGHNIGPRFLGHLTENGRVMGILMQYIPDSRYGTIADLGACIAVLRRLHEFKILLVDINRNNFLLSVDGRQAMICDFASSELDADDAALKEEEDELLTSLESDEFDEEDGMWDIYGQQRFTEVPRSEYRI